jgi:hypothetical protein
MDANAFKALLYGNGISMVASLLDQPAIYESLVIPESPLGQVLETEVGVSLMGSMLVINQFPFGSPGAPVPGIPWGCSM